VLLALSLVLSLSFSPPLSSISSSMRFLFDYFNALFDPFLLFVGFFGHFFLGDNCVYIPFMSFFSFLLTYENTRL